MRKIGQLYVESGETYILARVDVSSVALICLQDGNYWGKPTHVGDINRITKVEWATISKGGQFIRIRK